MGTRATAAFIGAFTLACLLALGALGAPAAQAGPPSHPTVRANSMLYAPMVRRPPVCSTSSNRNYGRIPMDNAGPSRPDYLHADLNLALRSYVPTTALLDFVYYGGDTDPIAPFMPGIFSNGRVPSFVRAYQMYDWDWTCGPDGCRGPLVTWPPVTLLGMGAYAGEPLSIMSREPEVYVGAFKAVVLYAEERRITLGYTRNDSIAYGYAVHMENICVDPNLLALYRQQNAGGRWELPALRNGETLGVAATSEVVVAIRDCGMFMDPRSRKDWWQGV